jgi:VanZ family protein
MLSARRRKLAWLAVAAIALAIMVLSLLPQPDRIMRLRLWDKIKHAFAYGTLALFLAHALFLSHIPLIRVTLYTIVSETFYGILLECLQWLFPPRSAELLDALANAIGACLGTMLFLIVVAVLKVPQASGRLEIQSTSETNSKTQ